MVICVDFDGTCVTHEFPKVGKDIGAVPVLKELVANGHQLVLFTMRDDRDEGTFLTDAVNWFKENEIPLYGIQTNPRQKDWTNSPKAYGQLYIDDAALGIPLYVPLVPNDNYFEKLAFGRAHVDWKKVRKMLIDRDIIIEK